MSEELEQYDYIIDAFTRSDNNTNLEVNNLNVGCISSTNNKFNLDSEGNLTVKTVTTTGQNQNTLTIDSIYPVGSIYMSINLINPNTLFGGTWEQIKDRFLLSAGDIYGVGSVGGESAHTLTEIEIPWHYHSYSGNTNASGSHVHTGNSLETYSTSSSNSKDFVRPINNSYSYANIQIMNSAGEHSHSYSGNTSGTGGSGAHNNMPPYLTVYMWKRTA